MKKRVLSIVLALTLCFTMFASIGFVAEADEPAGRVERNLDRVERMLKDATPEQKAVVDEYVKAQAEAKADVEPWNSLVNGMLITDEMLADETEILPYFMMRYIQEDVEVDPEVAPTVYEAIQELEQLDIDINTGDDTSLQQSLNKFDPYAERLTAIAEKLVGAKLELALTLGLTTQEEVDKVKEEVKTEIEEKYKDQIQAEIDAAVDEATKGVTKDDFANEDDPEAAFEAWKEAKKEEITTQIEDKWKPILESEAEKLAEEKLSDSVNLDEVWDKAREKAKTDAIAVIEAVRKAVFFPSEGGLIDGYKAIMANDRLKKDAALLLGKDLMKEISGAMGKVVNYAKDEQSNIVSIVNNYKADLLSTDKAVSVKAAHDLAAELAAKAEQDADSYPEVKEVADLLADRGLSFTKLASAFDYMMNGGTAVDGSEFEGLDPNGDFQIIWMDRVLQRLLIVSDRSGDGVYSPYDYIDVELGHRIIDNKMGKELRIPSVSSMLYFVSKTDGVTAVNDSATGCYLKYTPSDVETAEVEVYRGSDAVDGTDVYRYVDTITLKLEVKQAEKKEITVEDISKNVYHKGDKITITGTSKGYETIIIYITDPNGNKFVLETVVPDQDGKYSYEFTIDEAVENIIYDSPYTVEVGDADGTATTSFTITQETEQKNITVEDISKNVYHKGDTVTIKGTSKGYETIIIYITEPSGKRYAFETVLPAEDGTYEANFTIEDAIESVVYDKPYAVEVGDASGTVKTSFTITLETGERSITVDNDDLGSYHAGDTITIKGTSVGYETIIISIYPEGEANEENAIVIETVTPEAYAAGVQYTLPENIAVGNYVVTIGDADGQVTTKFQVVSADTKILVSEEAFKRITGSRGMSEANLIKKLPTTITLVTDTGEKVTAPVTWDTSTYNSKLTTVQTLTGTYEIPEGYATTKDVDGIATIEVKLSSSSGGSSGGSTTSIDTEFVGKGTSTAYDATKKILNVKATTDYTKLIVRVTDPNGNVVKELTLTKAQLTEGYAIDMSDVDMVDGKYTVQLVSTVNGKIFDTYTFTTGIFTTDHINYIVGFTDGTVRPEAYISREEVTTILFRLLTDESRQKWLAETTDKFSDVEADRWSMTSIATLTKAGILNGYLDGTFGPDKEITRAEFAALCSRFAIESKTETTTSYSDIEGSWAEDDINAVSAAGWFQGADGKFRPDDKMTRAEAVTVINRMLGRDSVDKSSFTDDIVKFSDLDETAWYYEAIVEAANAHTYKMVDGKEVWDKKTSETDWTTYED